MASTVYECHSVNATLPTQEGYEDDDRERDPTYYNPSPLTPNNDDN